VIWGDPLLTARQYSRGGCHQLQDGVYVEVEASPTFPQVPKERLYAFLEQAKEDEIEAVQSLRTWWQK